MNQFFCFIIYISLGIILSLIYDLFKTFRNLFLNNKIVGMVIDMLFIIITTITIIITISRINLGELRFYIFLGIIIGSLIYFITFSRFIANMSNKLLNIFKHIIKFISSSFNKVFSFFKKIIQK